MPIFESLPVKVFTTDFEGRLNYLNASWYNYTGRLCESPFDDGWTRFVHPDDLPCLLAQLSQHPHALDMVNADYRLRRHDGVYRWHRSRCMPLPTLGDVNVGCEWAGVIVDVDDEHTARQRAERLKHELEVQSQWADSAVMEFREEIDVLQKERIARQQFVAMLAHDLRAPLTVSRLGIERLQRSLKKDVKLSQVGARVARSISRADAMLEDFLDVSRISAGKCLPLTCTWQSLRDIVATTLQDLDPWHASSCVLAESQEGLGSWDASSVQRVVENLVGNARKYGERDTPITVQVTEREQEVILCVHNRGEPIAPADQQRLFEHFERLDTVQTNGQRGWGIGLTLVAGIAHAYGGRVTVQSAADVGTTFWVSLPRGMA